MRTLTNVTAILFTLFGSCSSDIKPEEIYGKWSYTHVENRDPREEDLSDEELKEQNPAIIFSRNGDLVIEWGGKRLSHGKFRMDGKMIRFTEELPGNTTREFPFLIKELTASNLVFSTMEQNLTTVYAKRAPKRR